MLQIWEERKPGEHKDKDVAAFPSMCWGNCMFPQKEGPMGKRQDLGNPYTSDPRGRFTIYGTLVKVMRCLR